MSYLTSYVLLKDAIRTLNYPGIVKYKDELQKLATYVQIELFAAVLAKANVQEIKNLLLIIDTYCPIIEYDLLYFSMDTNNIFLFKILYEDYNIPSKNIMNTTLPKSSREFNTWALRYAACRGCLDILKYINITNLADELLRLAAENGHLHIIIHLVEKCGANIRSMDDYAVIHASLRGYTEVVKYLINCGANYRVKDDWPVCLASSRGYLAIVKYLVELGSDPRANNDLALKWASTHDHLETVKYLVYKGAPSCIITDKQKEYISFCNRMEILSKTRAQKKLYFWWIPICYDITRDVGKRMLQKNYRAFQEMTLLMA